MFIQGDNLERRRDRSDDFLQRTTALDFSNFANIAAEFDNQFDEIVGELVEGSDEEDVDFVEDDVVVENDVVA